MYYVTCQVEAALTATRTTVGGFSSETAAEILHLHAVLSLENAIIIFTISSSIQPRQTGHVFRRHSHSMVAYRRVESTHVKLQ